MRTKQLNVKHSTCYFYNDLINALNFEPFNLKLDKKNHGKTLIPIILLMLKNINLRIIK